MAWLVLLTGSISARRSSSSKMAFLDRQYVSTFYNSPDMLKRIQEIFLPSAIAPMLLSRHSHNSHVCGMLSQFVPTFQTCLILMQNYWPQSVSCTINHIAKFTYIPTQLPQELQGLPRDITVMSPACPRSSPGFFSWDIPETSPRGGVCEAAWQYARSASTGCFKLSTFSMTRTKTAPSECEAWLPVYCPFQYLDMDLPRKANMCDPPLVPTDPLILFFEHLPCPWTQLPISMQFCIHVNQDSHTTIRPSRKSRWISAITTAMLLGFCWPQWPAPLR